MSSRMGHSSLVQVLLWRCGFGLACQFVFACVVQPSMSAYLHAYTRCYHMKSAHAMHAHAHTFTWIYAASTSEGEQLSRHTCTYMRTRHCAGGQQGIRTALHKIPLHGQQRSGCHAVRCPAHGLMTLLHVYGLGTPCLSLCALVHLQL